MDASGYKIFVGLRFTGHKGTPLMVARLSFQKFNSFMQSGARETREFQFGTELTTAKVSLVMSLVMFPMQFPSAEKISLFLICYTSCSFKLKIK